MEKKKILWVGDAVAATGFGSVSGNILSNLPKGRYDIHQLGVNYFGDPHNYKYKIYPAGTGGDVYGIGRLDSVIKFVQPDVIGIINDPWIIHEYLKTIKGMGMEKRIPIVVYFPTDAEEHSLKWFEHFDIVDAVCVYTEFGRAVTLASHSPNINPEKVHVIPHGTDTENFYEIPKMEAWSKIFPKQDISPYMNSFVVFNGNRNQPRKRIDITMWMFREFQKGKPDVRLYLHMGTIDTGVDIIELAIRYGFANKFIITGNTPTIPNVPIERLNLIYNSADIGINTSTGEGWGLVSWEQAATRTPQIVPYSSCLPYIWNKESAIFLDAPTPHMHPLINTVGRVVDVKDGIRKLNWAYDDWKNNNGRKLEEIANNAYAVVTSDQYKWENIAKQFHKIFMKVMKENDNDNVA